MEVSAKLKKIQEDLKESDNEMLSMLLASILERQSGRVPHVIGVLGDDLVGKSTIINSLLGETVIPVTSIPSLAEITIRYGSERVIYDGDGAIINDDDLLQSVEEKDILSISVNNEFLKDNSLIIKEYHGGLRESKINDLKTMNDLYRCDAIFLVLTAQHLLSETESSFIENYIKYVGAKRLLLIVNKLDLVVNTEVEHVLDYIEKQIALKFSGVEWTVSGCPKNYEEIVDNYVSSDFKTSVKMLFRENHDADDTSIINTLKYIKEQLEIQHTELLSLEKKSKVERDNAIKQKEQQIELEKAAIENAKIEFQKKRNNTVELIDEYIKDQFVDVLSKIESSFLEAPKKYFWYEKELDPLWRSLAVSVSKRVDCYAASEIGKDVDWLNGFLETKLGADAMSVHVSEKSIKSDGKIVPNEKYKRYGPIGIAGGAVAGYCLLRMIGAVIGLGGGLLAYSYLEQRDFMQTEEIQKKLSIKIKDISLNLRKVSKREINKIYADILSEFNNEAARILEERYGFDYDPQDKYIEQRHRIEHLIKTIQEV